MSEYIFLKMYKKKEPQSEPIDWCYIITKEQLYQITKKKHPTWALSNAATAKLSNTHKREKYLEGNIV